MRLTLFLAAALTFSAPPALAFDEADALFGKIKMLCGTAYEGRVVTSDPRDADMAGQRLVMHVAQCSDEAIAIPFHVGENRSRTWHLTRIGNGLRLKHDHRHEDGTPDKVTMYGGDTASPGSETRQEFPVDEESKAMFLANELTASVTNVWAIEIVPGERFVYELSRKDRLFRVEFDLSKPVEAPPPPWGDQGNSGAGGQP